MVSPKGDFDSAGVGSMRRRVVPPSCMSEEQFHLDEICTGELLDFTLYNTCCIVKLLNYGIDQLLRLFVVGLCGG